MDMPAVIPQPGRPRRQGPFDFQYFPRRKNQEVDRLETGVPQATALPNAFDQFFEIVKKRSRRVVHSILRGIAEALRGGRFHCHTQPTNPP